MEITRGRVIVFWEMVSLSRCWRTRDGTRLNFTHILEFRKVGDRMHLVLLLVWCSTPVESSDAAVVSSDHILRICFELNESYSRFYKKLKAAKRDHKYLTRPLLCPSIGNFG